MQMQPSQLTAVASAALEKSIVSASDALLGLQQADCHWVFELEADDTIPAEYVLLRHHLGEPVDAAWKPRSQATSCAGRAPMAAGRWSRADPST